MFRLVGVLLATVLQWQRLPLIPILTIMESVLSLRAIPLRMADAWTKGNAEEFTAFLADDADFMIFNGQHLQGRENIRKFHQQIFNTVVKDTRLEAEVKFIRFIQPNIAVIHSVARMAFPCEDKTSSSRDSMQLFVVKNHEGSWLVEVVQNSRILTVEQQPFWDNFTALTSDDQLEVTNLAASLSDRSKVATSS